MKQRIITALCGIPVLVAFIWYDTPRFPLLILLIAGFAALGALEFYRLATLAGARPMTVFGVAWCLLFVVGAHLDANYKVDYLIPSLLGSALILPVIWSLVSGSQRSFVNWSWTVVGILYLGWLLSHYVSLREEDEGREWVILTVFSVFACDTAAFFVGRAWGKHRLAPTISPQKTWEGAIGGSIGAPAAAVIIYALLNVADRSLPTGYAQIVFLGFIVGVVAQLGDLLESLLKRKAGAKDSGRLLPGHGGILDRIDSLVITGAIAYYYVVGVVG
ncbi:MAG: phosphatidate cytidylyltransferase [Chloroflexi bacterium]|nr:phosphatidate cytidylyltransferase [Chloroflexota bacterium]